MRMRSFLLALLFLAPLAHADNDDSKGKVIDKPVVADTGEKFAELAKHIRDEMASGGRYEFISATDRGKAEADLAAMQDMLTKAGSVESMKPDEKLRLFNAQEHINGILTHSDANRLICERRAPVGTSIPQTTCRTLGEVERQRRATGKYLLDGEGSSDQCRNSHLCNPAEGVSRGSKH
jgi:hypothetical protein